MPLICFYHLESWFVVEHVLFDDLDHQLPLLKSIVQFRYLTCLLCLDTQMSWLVTMRNIKW
jgi:hypothetical protein